MILYLISYILSFEGVACYSVILGMCAGRWGLSGSSRHQIKSQKSAQTRRGRNPGFWIAMVPAKDPPGAIWTMNVVIIWKKSRSLARSGTKRRQNARVNATFSRSYAFSYSKQPFWHQNVPGSTPALPRLYLGSASAANISFLLIFIDFDCENRYDREKVASTLTFWRRLAPEHKSGRNFFKITTTFTVQIAICWPCYRVLFRPDSPRTVPIFGGPRGHHRYR